MSVPLTDTQLMVLSAAAQREDRCLVAPKTLKGGAAHKFAERLLAGGLVKEVKAKPGTPAWRRDAASAQSYALKLTAAGLKAIAVEEDDGAEETMEAAGTPAVQASPSVEDVADVPTTPAAASLSTAAVSPSAIAASPTAMEPSPAAPRDSSKSALVVDLLRRDGGATLAELVAATAAGCRIRRAPRSPACAGAATP